MQVQAEVFRFDSVSFDDEQVPINVVPQRKPQCVEVDERLAAVFDLCRLQTGEGKDTVVVIFNKKNIEFHVDTEKDTLGMFREQVSTSTSVPQALQKLMLKGAILKDDSATLATLGVRAGVKLLLVGSPISDVVEVNEGKNAAAAAAATEKSPSQQRTDTIGEGAQGKLPHKQVIEKGPPSDALPGLRGTHEPAVPASPMGGLVNSRGERVRLTFKVFSQELWIGTAAATEKLPFGAIRQMFSEPIVGHEEYSIIAFQLGQTEASRYYVYWVPSQYVRAIRNLIK